MSLDPITWLEGRVSKVESDLRDTRTSFDKDLKELKSIKDKIIVWVQVVGVVGLLMVNLNRSVISDLLLEAGRMMAK